MALLGFVLQPTLSRTWVSMTGSGGAEEEVGVIDAEDAVPAADPYEIDVWLTEWQVAEASLDVALGQHVDWALVPMDQNWLARLFAGRRTVALQLDTYADATRDVADPSAWILLSGRVVRIHQVSVRYHPSENAATRGVRMPEVGGAMEHSVSSLQTVRSHHGDLAGWIVRVRVEVS